MFASIWRGRLALPPLLLLLCAGIVIACEEKKAKDTRKVRVSLVIILASESETKVDKKVKGIADEVRKIHPKLKGFKMKDLQCKSVPIGTANKFELIDGQSTTITIQKAADKMDRI